MPVLPVLDDRDEIHIDNVTEFLTQLTLLSDKTGVQINGGHLSSFLYEDGEYTVDENLSDLRFEGK